MPKPRLFEPWAPPLDVSAHEVASIKALSNGTASEHQQQTALHFILVKVCCVDDEPFCPGEDGRRATDYALGKRRVGLYLRSLLHANIDKFKQDPVPREQP